MSAGTAEILTNDDLGWPQTGSNTLPSTGNIIKTDFYDFATYGKIRNFVVVGSYLFAVTEKTWAGGSYPRVRNNFRIFKNIFTNSPIDCTDEYCGGITGSNTAIDFAAGTFSNAAQISSTDKGFHTEITIAYSNGIIISFFVKTETGNFVSMGVNPKSDVSSYFFDGQMSFVAATSHFHIIGYVNAVGSGIVRVVYRGQDLITDFSYTDGNKNPVEIKIINDNETNIRVAILFEQGLQMVDFNYQGSSIASTTKGGIGAGIGSVCTGLDINTQKSRAVFFYRKIGDSDTVHTMIFAEILINGAINPITYYGMNLAASFSNFYISGSLKIVGNKYVFMIDRTGKNFWIVNAYHMKADGGPYNTYMEITDNESLETVHGTIYNSVCYCGQQGLIIKDDKIMYFNDVGNFVSRRIYETVSLNTLNNDPLNLVCPTSAKLGAHFNILTNNIVGDIDYIVYGWSKTVPTFSVVVNLNGVANVGETTPGTFDGLNEINIYTPSSYGEFKANEELIFAIKIVGYNYEELVYTKNITMLPPDRPPVTITGVYGSDIPTGTQYTLTNVSGVPTNTSYIHIYFSNEMDLAQGIGANFRLTSGKNTYTCSFYGISDDKKHLIVTVPSKTVLDYLTAYALVIPTVANGGPRFLYYYPGLANDQVATFTTQSAGPIDSTMVISLNGDPAFATRRFNNLNFYAFIECTTGELAAYSHHIEVGFGSESTLCYSFDCNKGVISSVEQGVNYITATSAPTFAGNKISMQLAFNESYVQNWHNITIKITKTEGSGYLEKTFNAVFDTNSYKVVSTMPTSFTNVPWDGLNDLTLYFNLSNSLNTDTALSVGSFTLDGSTTGIKSASHYNSVITLVIDKSAIAYSGSYELVVNTNNPSITTNMGFAITPYKKTLKIQAQPITPITSTTVTGYSADDILLTDASLLGYSGMKKFKLNITQTNGNTIEQIRYKIMGVWSEYEDYTLGTDKIITFTGYPGGIEIQAKAGGTESLIESKTAQVIDAITYTKVFDPKIISINDFDTYNPSNIFEYANNNANAEGTKNYLKTEKWVVECPVQFLHSVIINDKGAVLSTIPGGDFSFYSGDVTKVVVDNILTETVVANEFFLEKDIVINFRDKFNNWGTFTRHIVIDNKPPTISYYSLKNSADEALNLLATNDLNIKIVVQCDNYADDTNAEILVSEDGTNFVHKQTVALGSQQTINYTVSSNTIGIKHIYIKSRDTRGNISDAKMLFFDYDNSPVSGSITIESGAERTRKTTIDVALTSTEAVKYKIAPTEAGLTSATSKTYTTGATVTEQVDISGVADGATATVWVQYEDAIGNVTNYSDSIIVKRSVIAPIFTIAEGTRTKSSTVTINLSGFVPYISYYQVINDGVAGSNIPFGQGYSFTVNLSDGDGNKIIGIVYTDIAGNVSTTTTQTIYYDTTPPIVAITSVGVTNDSWIDVTVEQKGHDEIDRAESIQFAFDNGTFSEWKTLSTSLDPNSNVFQLPFDSLLPVGTKTKNFILNAKVKDACGNISTDPITLNFTYDITNLVVAQSIVPSNVEVGKELIITFNKNVDANTVNKTNILVQGEAGTLPHVNYSVNLDSVDKKILKINANLDYLKAYKITISTALTDYIGNALNATYSLSFTTEPDPVLKLLSTGIEGQENSVPADHRFNIRFSWPLNFETVNSSNIVMYPEYKPDEAVECSMTRGINDYVVKIIPYSELENGVKYFIEFNNNVKSITGATFKNGETKKIEFTTAKIEPLFLFETGFGVLKSYNGKGFTTLVETKVTQNLIKKYGISANTLSLIPKTILRTLEKGTKVVMLANNSYTDLKAYAVTEVPATLPNVISSTDGQIIHDNYFWHVSQSGKELNYDVNEKNTITFTVPKTDISGNSTANSELKVLCKVRK